MKPATVPRIIGAFIYYVGLRAADLIASGRCARAFLFVAAIVDAEERTCSPAVAGRTGTRRAAPPVSRLFLFRADRWLPRSPTGDALRISLDARRGKAVLLVCTGAGGRPWQKNPLAYAGSSTWASLLPPGTDVLFVTSEASLVACADSGGQVTFSPRSWDGRQQL